jgi:DNA-3-methyladenine glycosylase
MEQHTLKQILSLNVLQASEALVGCRLIRGGRVAQIVETEAYRAEDDPACHAYRSRTVRNETMWGPPGHAYVYLNYGLHWMLNVTAHEPGRAAAVLIRAAEPLAGFDEFRAARPGIKDPELLRGPGKLCRAFGITRADDGMDLLNPESELHIEVPSHLGEGRVGVPLVAGPRIGIAVGQDFPWRFADATRLEWVSRPVPPKWR